MNHVYRVIWNGSAACWQAVSEAARGKSKSGKSTNTSPAKLLKQLALVSGVAASMAVSGVAMAAPNLNAIVSGVSSIGVSGSTTTVNQNASKAIINWNDFSIANGETVNFVQPDANAIALNRVVTATPSSIQGALNANGQVFIVNPNGITFGSTAQVNVGGLVASTLDISDSDFNGGTYRFNGSSSTGITNQGAITVANTGTAALIAPSIQQAGTIVNNDGSILLTAASDVTLSLTNRVLNSQTINAGHNTATINNSAGTLQADGGKVILTAQGVNSSSTASISSAGTIRAQTLAGNDRGAIDLIADSASGVVNLTGTLDASAPTNGFGGTIRTIGADVAVANSASVTTRKVNQTNLPGTSSYWQIKANSINVGSGGTISGSELSSSLNDGSVTLTASGTGTGQGNININDAVSTNSNVILSLAATKDINFNNNVGLTANLGRLILGYGSSNDYNLNNGSKITLSGAGATLRINSTDYTVVNSLGVAGDTTSTTLQGIKNNLSGNYALGSDIDASATSGWNSGKGFDPIGTHATSFTYYDDPAQGSDTPVFTTDYNTPFIGKFHGLGHTVSNLNIDNRIDPGTISNRIIHSTSTGLFGSASTDLRDITLSNANIKGDFAVGGLVGHHIGTISNVNVSGTVVGESRVGGIVGLDANSIQSTGVSFIKNSSSTASVAGYYYVGGLAGGIEGSITNSYNAGSVTGKNDGLNISHFVISDLWNDNGFSVGGLAGHAGSIYSSHNTGTVTGSFAVGGLVGTFISDEVVEHINPYSQLRVIKDSYSTGNINGVPDIKLGLGDTNSHALGGLVGIAGAWNSQITAYIDNSYATGKVQSNARGNFAGGLAGYMYGDISNSYASGDVKGGYSGGLVSVSTGTISNSYSTGNIQGSGAGFVVENGGSIINSYSTGNVDDPDDFGSSGSFSAGFVLSNWGSISNSYSAGNVSGKVYYNRPGTVSSFAVYNSGTISNSYATGNLSLAVDMENYTSNNGEIYDVYALASGFVGINDGSISNSYAKNSLSLTVNPTPATINLITSQGGLVEIDPNGLGTVTNSYWDTTTSGQSTSAGGTGKTTAQLKQIATFTGWDIADVSNTSSTSTWVIDENSSTPWLR